MDYKKAKSAFSRQCVDAKKRGIEMRFTLDEWINWWETKLGPDWQQKRGCHRGQFVMARRKDLGHYEASNVRCRTVEQNHQEHNFYKPAPKGKQRPKLTKETVISIYNATGDYANIAQMYNVGKHQVHCIKTGKYYSSITKHQ